MTTEIIWQDKEVITDHHLTIHENFTQQILIIDFLLKMVFLLLCLSTESNISRNVWQKSPIWYVENKTTQMILLATSSRCHSTALHLRISVYGTKPWSDNEANQSCDISDCLWLTSRWFELGTKLSAYFMSISITYITPKKIQNAIHLLVSCEIA